MMDYFKGIFVGGKKKKNCVVNRIMKGVNFIA
jgi:hypothetical protein